ncbi:antitoxin [Streptomyces sp. NPDC093595]|uniref:antitoxin n=1 Tax=Streptomyces sp. NPDC093595 TaxID=3366045 RepID=UPI003820CAAB
MSMMDKLKHMLKGHEEQTGRAVDKAGDAVDARTQGKYRRQVDTAQKKLRERYGHGRGHGPGQEPPRT